jgi:hypothetical protein
MATNNAINLQAAGVPTYDPATGIFSASTTTQHSVLVGDTANKIKNLGVATNGQLVIGSTGSDPVLAGLTAGSNVTITPGAGSITIAAAGGLGFTFTDVTGTTQTMVPNAGYTSNNASQITFTLPTTAAYGSLLAIVGKNTGGWTIEQNALQSIVFGSLQSTVGVTGSLSSTNAHDVVFLICIVANTTWAVTGSMGNLTVA